MAFEDCMARTPIRFMALWLGLLVVTGLAAIRVSLADAAPDAPSQKEMLAWLRTGDFDQLDQRYNSIQQAYDSELISDEDLRAPFRVFYLTDPALKGSFAAWVKHSPMSYAAHLARGIYFENLGKERRGGDAIEDTSAEQLQGAQKAFGIALGELQQSMALTKRPILSYLYAIDATRFVGTQKRTRQLFDQAIGIDAHSVVIREMYMVALQTAWGGSQKAMRDLLENARAAGLPDSRLRILESVIVADQAWVYNFNDHNYDAAAKAYLKSYDLNPEASCLKCAAAAFLDAHEPDRAREIFNRLLALNPSDTEAMVRRGWVDINNGRSQDGLADIQHAANLKDALGEYSLGELYLQGRVVPYDKDKGLALVKLAAAQNYLPATSMLDAISKGLWPSRVNPPQ